MRYVAEESSQLMESSIEAKAEAKRASGTRPSLKTRGTDQGTSPGTIYTPPEFRRPQNEQQNEASPQPPDNSKKPPF
jgi:hypothetical protein